MFDDLYLFSQSCQSRFFSRLFHQYHLKGYVQYVTRPETQFTAFWYPQNTKFIPYGTNNWTLGKTTLIPNWRRSTFNWFD